MQHLGRVSEEAEREIYERALLMLEDSQGDDDSGVSVEVIGVVRMVLNTMPGAEFAVAAQRQP